MRHPFDLDLAELNAIDLDFEECLTAEEAAQVGGGMVYTTMALGEEGGCFPYHPPKCRPISRPCPIDPPVTTLALGEEGGDPPISKIWLENGGHATTKALGEEGGLPIDW
ncbi:MAG: hypothetical protein HC769_21860 [Cyanobacteria bacterium CRU_2_1]|nr:hypothetical protein [Cyanobacteria bacterium RU_5_0]NJR61242.1 hypothetical protein [Cyanobacteria bacterium CRU_2_1]